MGNFLYGDHNFQNEDKIRTEPPWHVLNPFGFVAFLFISSTTSLLGSNALGVVIVNLLLLLVTEVRVLVLKYSPSSHLKPTMAKVIEKFFITSMLMWMVPIAILYAFNNNLFPGSADLSPHSLTLISGFVAVVSVNNASLQRNRSQIPSLCQKLRLVSDNWYQMKHKKVHRYIRRSKSLS